ncbi:drug/metabolite transporter (DMT)-like permease [Ureibacillus xyleni]|uniref:Drug/metabolite transporter (DMT)-like permease n=1 Tax=Ureibacillus xyleni TaxID=614648 RepID=A0A285RZ20_9BACL|nr:DMT family transporter [Ureibacillus xyleni]SOB99601.1 drug/metabolite transporter (DMT)-like permease [Ureibacillus xyleni]
MNSKALLLGLFTVVIWGSTFAANSVSLQGGYSAGHLILFRFLIASAIFVMIAFIPSMKIRIPEKQDFWKIMLLGWVGISGYHICATNGQLTISAGTAGMLIGSGPIFTTILAIIILKERLGKVGWIGLGFGFIGIILIALGSGDTSLGIAPGVFLTILAAIATSIFFVYQKPFFKKYSAIELTAYCTWAGTIPFLLFAPGFFTTIQTATLEANLTSIYIGIFPTAIAYFTWAIALSLANASSVSSILYLEPVIAIIVAWIWLGELPSSLTLIGGLVAISGVLVVNFYGKKQTFSNNSTNKIEQIQ